jgi:UDP-GlcNAc:undecaprenyl-phosphate GlcNAc-1-phosphate transferase
MPTAIFLSACALIFSILLTPLFRNFALRRGWVDQPDNNRKIHSVAVPRIGGVPIALASAASVGLVMFVGRHGKLPIEHFELFWRLLPAFALVFLTGLWDDLIGLKPWQKLAGQTAAAALACWAGLRIEGIADHMLPAIWGMALTVVWLVGCTNAFNLIDGSDGVATGVGLFAALTTGIAALLHGDIGLMMATAPLAGALCGFLWFNFNPASIFLGDCGSLWVGFMLGSYAVIWSQKSATLLGMTAPVIALSIPLLDTGLAIARRFLGHQPIFRPDHGHIHHRLLERGLTPRRVALLIYGASGLAACLSLLQSAVRDGAEGIVIVLFCGSAWFGIQYLGYREFAIAARLVHHGFRSIVHCQLLLDGYEKSLGAARSPEECWQVILTAARELGFSSVVFRLDYCSYQDHLKTSGGAHWVLRIPLSESEYVLFTHSFEPQSEWIVAAPLANLVHKALAAKTARFRQPAAA